MEKKKQGIKVKVFCVKHAQKKLEYVCTNPNCSDKLYCGTCLFKKDYCRHDDYLKDLNEFLTEQKEQFDKKGLASEADIFDTYSSKIPHVNQYQGKINQQIKIIEDEFEKALAMLTLILNESKKSLIEHLTSYSDAFTKSFSLFEAKVNNNFLKHFFLSKFKSFDDMLNNFSPFTQESLRSMLNPILENYIDQYNIPDDIKESHSEILSLQNDTPIFDIDRYDQIKNYLSIFSDKMNQSVATLINVKSTQEEPPVSPSRVRLTTGKSVSTSMSISKLDSPNIRANILSNQSSYLPNINPSRQSALVNLLDSKIIQRSKSTNRSQDLSMISSPEKKMQKSITSINPRGPLNVTKIKHSASFDTGHTRTVFCLLYLGNRLAATGSDDGTIKIWDIITFGNLGELKGHSAGVRALAMLGGGNIASCSWDKTIKIWRTQSLTQQSDIEREQEISNMGNISTISFNGKNNDPNDVSLKTLVGHTFPVLCVQVLPDGKSIISGSSDYTVRMWDSESGSCLKSWTGHQSEVLCLAHTKFSNLILSGSGDRTVKVWNCDKKFNNASVKTLSGHSAYVWTIVILPDDSTVVSGSLDKSIKIWEIESGECLKTLKEHFGQILSLKVYKDDMLISADSDGNLKIWSISKSWAPITSLKKSDVKSPIYGVEVTEDFMILTTGADKRLSVWN